MLLILDDVYSQNVKGNMMKNKLVVTCLVLGSFLAPALSYAEDKDANRSEPKTYVKDSVITTKIKAKLAESKLNSLVHIKVDTDSKGEVLLSGEARTQKDADQALAIAKQVEGVTSVESQIKIKKDL